MSNQVSLLGCRLAPGWESFTETNFTSKVIHTEKQHSWAPKKLACPAHTYNRWFRPLNDTIRLPIHKVWCWCSAMVHVLPLLSSSLLAYDTCWCYPHLIGNTLERAAACRVKGKNIAILHLPFNWEITKQPAQRGFTVWCVSPLSHARTLTHPYFMTPTSGH